MDGVSSFPNFSKLLLDHKEQVIKITGDFETYSDFNFISLFSWGHDTAEISLLHGNLIIKLPDYIDGHPVYSIIGSHNIDESLNEILKIIDKIELVPEAVVVKITDPTRFDIQEDVDSFDYMYDLEELGWLAGSKYKKLRNKSSRFIKEHEGRKLDVRVLRTLTPEYQRRLKEVDKQWAKGMGRELKDTEAERKAISTLLDHAADFNLLFTIIEVDDEIKAFSINEIVDENNAVCHFEKALRDHHETIYTFLACQVAKELLGAGCTWVNWEQDLGIEGLRKAKIAYHPARMLKKYVIKRGVA